MWVVYKIGVSIGIFINYAHGEDKMEDPIRDTFVSPIVRIMTHVFLSQNIRKQMS